MSALFDSPRRAQAAELRERTGWRVGCEAVRSLVQTLRGARGALRRHGLPAGALHLLGAVLQRLAGVLRNRAAQWSDRRALDHAAKVLAAMDAQTLRDIGLTRCDAHSMAFGRG